jgi:cell division transport system permease protein
MRFLKSLISLTIPLFIVLTTFSLYSAISSVMNDYKKIIINDYAIMVVSNTPLIKTNIIKLANIKVKNIQTLQRDQIVENLKNDLSNTSIKLLKQKLPFFYKIYLDDYPTTSQLKLIKNQLKKISNIKRVETFSSDHTKIYSLLILIEKIIIIMLFFITVFAFLIFSKQIKIWFFEHNNRISIIEYHGGSIIYSALPIIKISIYSSIISSILTLSLIYFLLKNISNIIPIDILSVIPNITNISVNYLEIIIISFSISILSIIGVLIKYKIK